ncbi:type I restriction-modification system subunit M [Polaribacter sp. SA4-12]|uniref:type I restriction-modification system subunit M n=1 Tax=Polaribacter sp. SA4-12 TaxID=1312072 RepID=UPI000B3CCD0F|nr:type I restriction-modification system subunit M [Polaribacter sp. SA4-12]ARV14822.1 restriction endonuclease subunit M [Polaribacter sp. SA4-12]
MSTNNNKVDVGFIWRITDDVLRDAFKKNEIGDVLLPFVVIRRLDCMLENVNEKVRKSYTDFRDKVSEDKLDPILKKAAGGLTYYNTSKHTLHSLKDEPQYIEINFNNYLNGFNAEVRDILESFQFDKVIARLVKNRLLYEMIDAICKIDLHQNTIDNHSMGYVFEELIRVSNEQSNETAGEHFTPRDVIALMNAIIFTPEKDELSKSGIIRTIFDPACGTGGMVNLGKNFVLDDVCKDNQNKPTILTYGQELNEQSCAIAKSEALISGENPRDVKHGNSFTDDQFQGKKFHYMMANPPYGVTWKKDKNYIENEALNPAGRFYAGTPRSSDGQLLFLQHMISKMDEKNGSRIGVVTNGSPLFTGDAGSGESNIRKWIIENDWLECIVALPKDLFYNTGINTYIWFLTNKKTKERKGKVQLINANASKVTGTNAKGKEETEHIFARSNKKSLGNKRNELTQEHINELVTLYTNFEENQYCKIYNNDDFGFYQLTIEQPKLGAEEIEKLKESYSCFKNPVIKEKSFYDIQTLLDDLEHHKSKIESNIELLDDVEFSRLFCNQVLSKITKKELKELSEFLKKVKKPDSKKRDKENVSLGNHPDEYFEKEVLPHVPEAWIDYDKTRIGYEINFTKYFYEYKGLQPASEIKEDIIELEKEIAKLLNDLLV